MDANRLKQLKRAMGGRGGAPLRAAYRVATAGALVAVRGADRLAADPLDPGERAESAATVTMAVKTFKRPDVARRLVRSARRVFDGRIVVADDSPTTMSFDDPLVEVIAMPFNSGVSVGRNAALDAVDTEFVLVTDDDLVSTAGTEVDAARRRLQACPDIDVVGFLRVELPVRYKIEQTYLARTEAIRRVRWDPNIRMVDHSDFFSRAAGEIVVVLDSSIRAYHARTPFDPEYTRYRLDIAPDQAYLGRVWRQRAAERVNEVRKPDA